MALVITPGNDMWTTEGQSESIPRIVLIRARRGDWALILASQSQDAVKSPYLGPDTHYVRPGSLEFGARCLLGINPCKRNGKDT